MKLRELLTMALLGLLVGSTYAYMQKSDEEAAERDRAVWAGKGDR